MLLKRQRVNRTYAKPGAKPIGSLIYSLDQSGGDCSQVIYCYQETKSTEIAAIKAK